MPLVPGTHLGPYEITGLLGSGGMGEVYRARDTRLDRSVAIKILPAQFSSDLLCKQRFEREAKTISSLNHPHICVLHDIGSQDGVEYLVMECVEGETLARRLEKGALPLEQVLKYGAQIADALDKAHRAGIVHRDLKPANIMLTKAVWDGGTCTVDAVYRVVSRKRNLKETTVRTLLRRLEQKGYVRHEPEGRAYVYRAVEPARSLAARAVRQIIDRFCRGSVEELVSGMVEAKVLKKDDIEELEKFVRNRKRGGE